MGDDPLGLGEEGPGLLGSGSTEGAGVAAAGLSGAEGTVLATCTCSPSDLADWISPSDGDNGAAAAAPTGLPGWLVLSGNGGGVTDVLVSDISDDIALSGSEGAADILVIALGGSGGAVGSSAAGIGGTDVVVSCIPTDGSTCSEVEVLPLAAAVSSAAICSETSGVMIDSDWMLPDVELSG